MFRHIEPHLDWLGALAGGHLDECARLADRHVPVLDQRDRRGRDAQWIENHPAYRELERAAFGEFAIHAMSLRKGIMDWHEPYPMVAKHAFTFLFDQAEFGLGCPIDVTDGCGKLLSKFGSEPPKAKYLHGLTQTDMNLLTQGGSRRAIRSGSRKIRCSARSPITCSASATSAWPRLANCSARPKVGRHSGARAARTTMCNCTSENLGRQSGFRVRRLASPRNDANIKKRKYR